MERIDRNQIIGIVLLMVMWGAYMYLMPEAPKETPKPAQIVAAKTTQQSLTTPPKDSLALKAAFGDFASAGSGIAKDIVVENKDVKITFSTLGGSVKQVLLKNYKTYKQQPLLLIDEVNSRMSLDVQTNKGKVDLKQLYYSTENQSVTLKEGDSTKVNFYLKLGENQYVQQTYSIKGSGFVVDYDLNLVGLDGVVQNQPIRFVWQDNAKVLENDLTENRKATQINYVLQKDDEFNDLGNLKLTSEEKDVVEPMSWFAFKQKYFVSGFIAKNQAMSAAKLKALSDEKDSVVVKTLQADVALSVADAKTGKGNYRFYFGPNDYDIVKKVTPGFNRNVYLGWDFVKPINRYVFVPIFNFFEKIIPNYGILIILVVLCLKIVLTPLLYKSLMSSAKMRVLAPEIASIKEKVGDDSVKLQQEQMKLYQQVGVSPLSGCVPMLLQYPILMSVFFLFPNIMMFRQKAFLWASDLSTYDAPIHWATNLPIVGNHLSAFAFLMLLSNLVFVYYTNQITPDQSSAQMPFDMKKVSYFFPFIFYFVMNSYPAALSFYYLVSNIITILQQQIIRKFVDEEKILAVLNANRVKFKANPEAAAKKGRFADYLQKSLQAAEEAKKQQEGGKKPNSNSKKK